jgi:folate-binding protein YgfZ
VNQNALYSLHEAAGAALLPREEANPLLTYGDVPAEYSASRESCALFDQTDRGMVRATGTDAPEFLQRLLANVVVPLEVGQGNRNLLLTGKGKIRFVFDLARDEAGFRLSTTPGQAPELLQALDMYLFAEDVQLIDATEEHAPLLIVGPGAENLLAGFGIEVPSTAHETRTTEFRGREARVTAVAPLGPRSFRLETGPEGVQALWEACVEAGARPAGRVVADSLRVEDCRALPGEDVDEQVYPQEARLEEAFDLSKGCYIGQEVVAKIDTYGGLNKRLCSLRVSHPDPVERGTSLFRWSEEKAEWRDLGFVTSWAYSFAGDSGQVLAYVKRRHQEPGTTFRLGEGPSEATILQ